MSPLGTDAQPLRVAIIGAGPAGFYAAERLLKETAVVVEVDLFDRLPTPYGLVRNGVAPDHQKIKSVTAAFTFNSYALTTATAGTGSGSVGLNPPGGTYSHGTVVAVTATPAAGSTFTGWGGACSDSGACSVTMDGAKSVTATFDTTSSPESSLYLPVISR